ncbi:hypothetical protein [Azospirillum doebereinerae]
MTGVLQFRMALSRPGRGRGPAEGGEGEGLEEHGVPRPIAPHPSHRFAAGPFPLPGREREFRERTAPC